MTSSSTQATNQIVSCSHIIILKTATFKFKIMSERKRKEIERVKEKSSEK